MRDQPAGGDKENPRLPWLAVQTPANFPSSIGSPVQLLGAVTIIRQMKAAWRGKGPHNSPLGIKPVAKSPSNIGQS